MCVHIDEARRHDLPCDTQHVAVLSLQVRADRGDALAFDAHIGDEARCTGTVDDGAALEDERAMAPDIVDAHDSCNSPLDHARSRTGCVSLSTPRSCSTCRTRFN